MRWIRRMKRRAQCRRRYGDECPHIENHSGKPRTWVPLTRIDSGRTDRGLPAWHVDPEGHRGMGARGDRVSPVSFIPDSRDGGAAPEFPQWAVDPKAVNRGAAARSQPPAN